MSTPPAFIGFSILIAFFFAFATAALVLRLYVRAKITRNIARDDYTLIAAHLCNIACGSIWLRFHIYAARFPENSYELSSYLSICDIAMIGLLIMSSAFNKAAIASFFLGLVQKKWQRWGIRAPLWTYMVYLVIGLFICFFRCGLPLNGHKIVTSLECPIPRNIYNTLGTIMVILNTLCDWVFAGIPLYMVWKAHRMDRSSKRSVRILIVLAISSSFVSLARIPFFAGGASFEPTNIYSTASIVILSVVENSIGVAVISIATLQPLLGIIRHGGLSKRPMLPLARQQTKPSASSPNEGTSGSMTPDWGFMRHIGILPDLTSDGARQSRGPVDSLRSGKSLPKLPAHTTVRVTRMMSIDEVMHSAAKFDGSTDQGTELSEWTDSTASTSKV